MCVPPRPRSPRSTHPLTLPRPAAPNALEVLPLILARRMVKLQAGRLSVESIVGAGSTFTFALPLALAAPPRSSSPRLRARGARSARADGTTGESKDRGDVFRTRQRRHRTRRRARTEPKPLHRRPDPGAIALASAADSVDR